MLESFVGSAQAKFLKYFGDNILMQMVQDPERREDLVNLLLTDREQLIQNVKVECKLGDSDRETTACALLCFSCSEYPNN